jgi:hypothetical protein
MQLNKANLLWILLCAALATTPARAACNNASVKGTYGIISTGLNGSLQPASSVDQLVLDGAGNLTGSSTKSIDGSIITFTFTGTYSISANCTGTTTFNNQDGTTKHDNIFLYNGNKNAFLIQTDKSHVEASVAVAAGAPTCTDLGVKAAYSMEATGQDIGVGQIAAGGRLTLNGTGSITGTATFSINGSITSSASTTGTYSINPDCTGTASLSPRGLPTINLNLLVVNGGKEIMFIETDTNTVVTGSMQQ